MHGCLLLLLPVPLQHAHPVGGLQPPRHCDAPLYTCAPPLPCPVDQSLYQHPPCPASRPPCGCWPMFRGDGIGPACKSESCSFRRKRLSVWAGEGAGRARGGACSAVCIAHPHPPALLRRVRCSGVPPRLPAPPPNASRAQASVGSRGQQRRRGSGGRLVGRAAAAAPAAGVDVCGGAGGLVRRCTRRLGGVRTRRAAGSGRRPVPWATPAPPEPLASRASSSNLLPSLPTVPDRGGQGGVQNALPAGAGAAGGGAGAGRRRARSRAGLQLQHLLTLAALCPSTFCLSHFDTNPGCRGGSRAQRQQRRDRRRHSAASCRAGRELGEASSSAVPPCPATANSHGLPPTLLISSVWCCLCSPMSFTLVFVCHLAPARHLQRAACGHSLQLPVPSLAAGGAGSPQPHSDAACAAGQRHRLLLQARAAAGAGGAGCGERQGARGMSGGRAPASFLSTAQQPCLGANARCHTLSL